MNLKELVEAEMDNSTMDVIGLLNLDIDNLKLINSGLEEEIEKLRTRNARLQTVADSVEAFINCEGDTCGTLYDHMEQCFYEYNEKEESE